MNLMIKILLVDDHALMRQGLRLRLGIEPDLNVIGEADNGFAALAKAQLLHPDVVIMDINMPEMNGITAAYLMNKSSPDCAVVLLSLFDSDQMRQEARDAGVKAFITKNSSTDPLLSAIRAAATV